jgi:hypothetical protein
MVINKISLLPLVDTSAYSQRFFFFLQGVTEKKMCRLRRQLVHSTDANRNIKDADINSDTKSAVDNKDVNSADVNNYINSAVDIKDINSEGIKSAVGSDDIKGAVVNEDIKSAVVSEDIKGAVVSEDIKGAVVSEDIKSAVVSEDIKSAVVSNDINSAVVSEDIKPETDTDVKDLTNGNLNGDSNAVVEVSDCFCHDENGFFMPYHCGHIGTSNHAC